MTRQVCSVEYMNTKPSPARILVPRIERVLRSLEVEQPWTIRGDKG